MLPKLRLVIFVMAAAFVVAMVGIGHFSRTTSMFAVGLHAAQSSPIERSLPEPPDFRQVMAQAAARRAEELNRLLDLPNPTGPDPASTVAQPAPGEDRATPGPDDLPPFRDVPDNPAAMSGGLAADILAPPSPAPPSSPQDPAPQDTEAASATMGPAGETAAVVPAQAADATPSVASKKGGPAIGETADTPPSASEAVTGGREELAPAAAAPADQAAAAEGEAPVAMPPPAAAPTPSGETAAAEAASSVASIPSDEKPAGEAAGSEVAAAQAPAAQPIFGEQQGPSTTPEEAVTATARADSTNVAALDATAPDAASANPVAKLRKPAKPHKPAMARRTAGHAREHGGARARILHTRRQETVPTGNPFASDPFSPFAPQMSQSQGQPRQSQRRQNQFQNQSFHNPSPPNPPFANQVPGR